MCHLNYMHISLEERRVGVVRVFKELLSTVCWPGSLVFRFLHWNKLPKNAEINPEVVFADKLQSEEVL